MAEAEDGKNVEYGKIGIEEVTADRYMLCCMTLNSGDSPEDPESHEVVAHHHVTVCKRESTITIVDPDREGTEPSAAVMPLSAFRVLNVFLAEIDKDPTVVMTDGEKAQFYADNMVAHYSANTN